MNGLPNGFYISRISIGDKYTVVKKLMLIYGSQHLITSSGTITKQLNKLNKTTLETNLDSLVATSVIIGRKTFTGLPNFVSGTLDLGDLTKERYCPGTPTVLYEGKTYNTVQIADQCWLKENLDVGVMIPGTQNATNNGVIEKYCYDNDTANCNIYGGLYLWNETMQYSTTPGVQGVCLPGWHIPTLAEFQTLKASVNSDGNSLKAVGQGAGGGSGTNTSGFSALLAGYRYNDGNFYEIGGYAGFWSSTEYYVTGANGLCLYGIDSIVGLINRVKTYSFSVRCVKD